MPHVATSGAWDWVSLIALAVSITVGLNGYLRNPPFTATARLDEMSRTISALQARCVALESDRNDALKHRERCEIQLDQQRREIAWMRDNMVLANPRPKRLHHEDDDLTE